MFFNMRRRKNANLPQFWLGLKCSTLLLTKELILKQTKDDAQDDHVWENQEPKDDVLCDRGL